MFIANMVRPCCLLPKIFTTKKLDYIDSRKMDTLSRGYRKRLLQSSAGKKEELKKLRILNNAVSSEVIEAHLSLKNKQTDRNSPDPVLFGNFDRVGVITLNRPKRLNALTFGMVKDIRTQLRRWEGEKNFVVIKSSGDKIFSCGGDLLALTQHMEKSDFHGLRDIFFHGYPLMLQMLLYSKPTVAIMDGIAMGAGAAMIGIPSKYTIATENTVFAAPEVLIGFYPESGFSYILPRLSNKLGLHLSLTGQQLKGADVVKAGLATHFIESSKVQNLINDLLEFGSHTHPELILKEYSSDLTDYKFSLESYLLKIDHCYFPKTVDGILRRLEQDGSEWANTTLEHLQRLPPLSLKIALKAYHSGSKQTAAQCLTMEYRITSHFLSENRWKHIYDGIQSRLVRKDSQPRWNPGTLDDVTDDLVDSYFAELDQSEEIKLEENLYVAQ